MNQRISYLDSIRGFSIIGILLVNITSFGWPELYDSSPSSYWNTPIDKIIHVFLTILIQSNFYPIFALLFGISVSFVFESAVKKGFQPYRILTKRMLSLLLMGAAHAFLIWYGDILMVYALFGLILLPFYKCKWKTLLFIGIALLSIPNILYGGLLYLTKASLLTFNNSSAIQLVIENYHSGTKKALVQNLNDWNMLYNPESVFFIFISIFPLFLIGLSIVKGNLLNILTKKTSEVNKLWIATGTIGLFMKCLPLLSPNYLFFTHISESFGGPLMGLFYSLTIVKFYSNANLFLKGLSFIGRMSLSNYLYQSVIGFILFKVLGIYGYTSPATNLLIAILILGTQVALSHYWLKTHSFGPVEGIWKALTYNSLTTKFGLRKIRNS